MGGYAWVTLATNDSYSLGALVLANSLRRVGTVHQLAVLITPGVTNSMREKLSSVYNVVKEVNILDSKDQNNLRLLQRPELGITFTKLNCWRLTQFDKCVFLDADTLLLQNADELFEREEFSAAPDVGWPDCFNSGVYVYKPSEATYENLVKFALQTGSFDGADQGLLNLYFNEWAHKDISKHLPFIYNVCSTATYSYMPAFKQYSRNIKIVHFIGNTKPWLQHFDFETRSVQTTSGLEHLHGIIQQWWEIFCSSVHPVLSQQMAGLAGAFAQLTLGCPSTVEQRILEDNLRRQNWESGNIDYMGRDAFDNIWSKICDTLSTPETVATQEKEQTTPAATIPENLSEREVSSKLSDDIPSDKSVSKEEKPQECITAPVIDTTSAIKVEPSISVVPSADKPVLPEDSSKIPETKTPTDVVPPPQESVPIAPLVSVTTQPAAQSESVPLKPSAPETTVDTSSIVLEESKIPEVVKVCETQPAEVKDTKCEKSIEESKEPSLATDSSPKQTEAIQSQASDAISSAAIKLSEVAVALPPSDVVVKSLEVLTPETISQTSAAPIIECVKTDEKPSEVVSEKPQCVPISEPSPQTKELETQPSLPTTCPLTESSQVEATKATTTPQQTKVCDAPKPKETQKSSSPSECSLKKSPEDENKKSESSKPQQTPKSPPPTECSLKKSQEAEPAKVETKKSESSKPQQTPKPPSPSERSAKKSPEVEPAKVVIKETESSKSQQTPKSAPPTERSAKKSPEGKPAQVASKESGIAKPQESPKSPQPTECSLKKTPEAETAKGISVQEIKGSGTTKPQETQKLPQADAAKTAKLASTAPQQPKEAGAPKPESQKVESEKEPKPSTKAQSSEAAAVSGSQQGPAPPPRKSGGTKKASGKSKK